MRLRMAQATARITWRRRTEQDDLYVAHPSFELGSVKVTCSELFQWDEVKVVEEGVVDEGQWMSGKHFEEECAGPFVEAISAEEHCVTVLTCRKHIKQSLPPTNQNTKSQSDEVC